MDKAEEFVRAEARILDPREILTSSVDVLLGVSAEAKAALMPLGIQTVFDLASSSLFHAARDLGRSLGGAPSSLAEHGQVPGDVVDDAARGNEPETLALCGIEVLRAVAPDARTALENALHVKNVRDLGLWPPYRAARSILAAAYGDVDDVARMDPEMPADLVPVNGRYPTERVQYECLILESLAGGAGEFIPLESAGQVDLAALAAEANGYLTPAVGVLLTYQQSWYARGLSLGNLIHSVALAPGESTKIAMIDWSRRTRTGTTEAIEENEVLQEDLGRIRALTEITSAVAKETQQGRSAAQTLASAWERGTAEGSASTGIIWDSGPHPGVRTHGESTGESGNTGFASSWSTSSGQREVSGKLQQDIVDRTQQAAHSTRTRRASIVREASQQESETLTTRTITNYNHMHALTVQYYEVVQQFRTVIEQTNAERVLFVPLRPLDFRNEQVVDRYRVVLLAAALTPTVRELLQYPRGTTRITSPLITGSGLYTPDRRLPPPPPPASQAAGQPPPPGQPPPGQRPPGEPPPGQPSPGQPPPGVATKPSSMFAQDRWTGANIVEARDATAGIANVLADGRLVLPADAILWDVDFLADDKSIAPVQLRLSGVDGSEVVVEYGERGWDLSGNRRRLEELASVRITTSGLANKENAGFVSCIFVFRSRSFRIVFPVRLVSAQSLDVFAAATVTAELAAHLNRSRLHYSRAIWNSVDDATLGILLSRFTFPAKTAAGTRGRPLVELVDPAPVGLVGNLLAFRAPGLGDEAALAEEYKTAVREDHIPVPSGGVFAEAVLGRFNAAERLDLTRFWDWADSPIPIQAPNIAALGSGSRGTEDDLRPGQLSSPVLNIVNPPGLPDPTGMTHVLAAIQNGMMFRDMSGLAGTIGLAQAGVAAAQQGAQHAAEQAGLNAKVAAELGAKVAEIVGKLIAAWTTGGAGVAAGGLAGAGLVGGGGAGAEGGLLNAPKGLSKSGSLLNYARTMDERGVAQPAGTNESKTSATDGRTWEAAAATSLGVGGGGPAGPMGVFADWVADVSTGVGWPFKGKVVDGLMKAAAEWKLPLTQAGAEAIAEAMSLGQAQKLGEDLPTDKAKADKLNKEKMAILREITTTIIAKTKDQKLKKELQDLIAAVDKMSKPGP
ncbi:unnamed protein product [[Actinomadura] parvosata subsp. kistnae]|uniref:Uncharacterized protein n=1 Tax=[Actinomadura] parvosata subsp. kistnae TaxID=1909395 RepID=A0A1U9ZYA1_9ACTN|nr:hypothetical protein [Nonomuraea sp. ATCC 55076]AQZ62933.1 hypothetical protein BKM31_17005 [Nonomuraea sp. ATCC 55076]SPL95828.1 unnamed protein product [Actinomadura parvosata subsp. kistnae]